MTHALRWICALLVLCAACALAGTTRTAGNSTAGSTAYPDGALRRIGAMTADPGENNFVSSVIDPVNNYAYFGTGSGVGKVVKVDISGVGAPVRIGTVDVSSYGTYHLAAVIDVQDQFAYFGAFSSNEVVKIALGAGAAAPSLVTALTPSKGTVRCAVIDTASTPHFAYFGTYSNPGQIIKVDLSTFTEVATRETTGHAYLTCATIDTTTTPHYAYFGTWTSPGKVIKVDLDAFTVVGTVLTLDAGENTLGSAVIDTTSTPHHAYFGTASDPGKIIKVDLSGASPARVGSYTGLGGENQYYGTAIDTAAGYLCTGSNTNPGRLVKVTLGAASVNPSRLTWLQLPTGESNPSTAVANPGTGHMCFGLNTSPGRVVKAAYSQKSYIKGTRMTLAEDAVVTAVRLYSHVAAGNMRLAIYDNGSPKNLLWDSESVANSAAGDFVSAAISSGTPNRLTLAPGTYWLAWQVDTTTDVPSYTTGAASEGFYLDYLYGAYPATITGETATTDRWTEDMQYENPQFVITGSATQTAGTTQTITVTAKDAGGVTVDTYIGTKSLTFSGANLSTNPATAPTVDGVAFGSPVSLTFTNGVATATLALYRAENASVSATQDNATTMTPLAVTVGHGAANKLIVTTQPSDGTAGVAWATQPVVTLQDAYGNTVLGTAQTVTVAFNANPGGATLFGTAVLALDIGTGQAVFTDLSIRKAAANYRLTATGDTVSTTAGQVLSGYFTISPGPAAQLAFTTQPGNSTVGALLSVQPVITLQDQFGNTVVGTAQTVTLAIQNNPNGNATLQGTTTVALSTIMGTANFSGLFLDWIGTGYTLTATGNAVSTTPGTAVSAAFDIAKGNPAVSWSNPADIVDGTALSATQLNAVASLPGTFAYTPPAGTVLPLGNGQTLSVQFTPTDGVNYNQATKQVTINVIPPPPSITIPATGPVTASAGQPFSYAIQAGGAQPMTFQVTGLPARLTLDGATISGQPTVVGTFNVTITATNSSGTDTKTLTLTFTAPDISGPGQSSADTDGDGFPDELETELGNSAIDSQSTPIANQPAPPIAASGVTKLGVKLNFGKPTATSDSLSLSGVLLPPAGFVAGGQTVVVDIGGVIRSYVLTTKGGSTDRQLKIGKPSKKDGKSKYSVRMKGSFASSLADEGLANEEIKIAQPVTVPVYIIFDTNWYGEQKSALYKARLNKTGSAK